MKKKSKLDRGIISAGKIFYDLSRNGIFLRGKEINKKKEQKHDKKSWKKDRGGGWSCDQLPQFFNFLFI